MDPSRENTDERRQEEEERMNEAYTQLERGFREEHWEQRLRKRREEEEEEKREKKKREKKKREKKKREKEKKEEEKRKKEEEEKQKKEEEEKQKKEEEEKRKKKAVDQSYEKLQTEVKKYDDGMVLGWKEDIDTLLVFAGLFSAVVTAFLIESYKWLSEEDTVILTQISQQLNGTQTEPAPFTPDASSIRINCFWFLSLIFSLTSALFGLLCKQWLREHQRDVPTRTVAENLALRQLRRDSFEKWGVASFLSALPILLELALVFFFVGVLDLLWTLQPIVFGICLAAISLSMGLYLLTTILPTITLPRDQKQFIKDWEFGKLAYQFICPYKSPQAWAIYKLFTTLLKPLLHFPAINVVMKRLLRPLCDHIQTQNSSWSTFDLQVVRQFDQEVYSFQLQIYELRALQWAITMFRDSPSMIPHLENVLKILPHSVALSTALDRWDIAMWEVEERDIGEYLRYPNHVSPLPKPIRSDAPLHSREGIELLFQQRPWGVFVMGGSIDYLSSSLKEFTLKSLKSPRISRFFIPLRLATTLWSHQDPEIQRLSLRLLQHFEEAWKPSPGYDEEQHDLERAVFARSLAEHICYSDPPSVLLTSKRGQEFVRLIHQEIIIRRLYSHHDFWLGDWLVAIEKVQRVGELPDDYFPPLPWRYADPPPSSDLPQLEPIRYSLDTTHSPSNHPQNEDGENPPMSTGGEIEIQVHIGNLGNTMSGVANLADGSSTNQGSSGLQAINENDALSADNDEPTTVGTIAKDADLEGSQIQAAQAITRAGEGDSAVSGEVVALDTNPDHLVQAPEDSAQASSVVVLPNTASELPTQTSEDGAGNIDSPPDSKGRNKRDMDEDEDQGIVGTAGSTAPSSSRDRRRRRDAGRGLNTLNDPNHLRMHHHNHCP